MRMLFYGMLDALGVLSLRHLTHSTASVFCSLAHWFFSTNGISYPPFSIHSEIQQISQCTFPLFCWSLVFRGLCIDHWTLSANRFQNPVLHAGMDRARVLPAPLPLTPSSPPWDYKSTPEPHTSGHDLAAHKQRDFSCLLLYLICNPCPSSRAKWEPTLSVGNLRSWESSLTLFTYSVTSFVRSQVSLLASFHCCQEPLYLIYECRQQSVQL